METSSQDNHTVMSRTERSPSGLGLLLLGGFFIFIVQQLLNAEDPLWVIRDGKSRERSVVVSNGGSGIEYHQLSSLRTKAKGGLRHLLQRKLRTEFQLVQLPSQSALRVLMLLSIIVSDDIFDQEVNEAIVQCLSNASDTAITEWGLYNATTFTASLLQAEYFADVSETASLTFAELVDTYIRNGSLNICVQDMNVGLGSDAIIKNGRTAIAPRSGEVVSSTASVPAWVAGIVVGVIVLLALIGLLLLAVLGTNAYKDEDFEAEEGQSADEEAGIENSDEAEQLGVERELAAIAGQRQGCLTGDV